MKKATTTKKTTKTTTKTTSAKTKNTTLPSTIEKDISLPAVESEIIDATIAEDIVEAPVLTRKVNMNDEVLVQNNTSGILVIRSNLTNRQWIIKEAGKKARMLVSDIIDVMSDQPIIFEEGWALILDDAVNDYLNLTENVKRFLDTTQLDRIFGSSDSEIEAVLKDLPSSMRDDISRYVRNKINSKDKRFDSRVRLTMLHKYLKFED